MTWCCAMYFQKAKRTKSSEGQGLNVDTHNSHLGDHSLCPAPVPDQVNVVPHLNLCFSKLKFMPKLNPTSLIIS